MTDEAEATDEPQSRAIATRTAPAPMMAGAEVAPLVPRTLEEAYRLAAAMAKSGMTPRNVDTPEKVLMSIMAGSELGMKPFQAVQSFAIINSRPSLWGDAIPALLYMNRFKIREWFENAAPDYPDAMTAYCEITRPDGQIVIGEFSVADAKEGKLWTKEGPWQTSRKRMLKMRARGFGARDGAADVLRGVFIAEEQQDIVEVIEDARGTGMAARLASRPAVVDPEGFNVNKITEATADAPKPRASRKKGEPAGESAPSAAPDNPTPASATDASTASAGETSGPQESAAPSSDGAQDAEFEDAVPSGVSPASGIRAYADPGEAYLLADEPLGVDGKWTLYKDGEGFSRIGTKGYEQFPICSAHPPTTQAKSSADYATINTDFIDDAPVESAPSIRTDPEDRHDPAQNADEEGGFEEAEVEVEEAPPTGIIAEMRAMTSWLQIKPRTVALYKEEPWKEMEEADQRDLRRAIWAEVERVKRDHRDPVDHAEDPTAFRLWIESVTGPKGADELDATIAALIKSERFLKMGEPTQQAVINVAKARAAELRDQ